MVVALEMTGTTTPAAETTPTAETATTAAGTASFQWTAGNVILSILLFVLAGVAEIGGGWLVWQTVRVSKPAWMAVLGCVVLILYGFIPTLQPLDSFGRVFAVYGGFFIILSYLWGWAFDGDKPDTGDWIGSGVALVGVFIALFWPR